jgi:adhesin transport system outer membrane protein
MLDQIILSGLNPGHANERLSGSRCMASMRSANDVYVWRADVLVSVTCWSRVLPVLSFVGLFVTLSLCCGLACAMEEGPAGGLRGSSAPPPVSDGGRQRIEVPPTQKGGLVADPQVRYLSRLVKQVFAYSPDLQKAESDSRQAELRVREAESGRLPTMSVLSGIGRERPREEARPTSALDRQSHIQLQVEVPLLDLAVDARIAQRRAQSLQSDWSLTGVRDHLALRTVELYAEVLRNSRLTELARQNLKTHRAYVDRMKDIARADQGRMSELPVAQARVSLAESVLANRLSRLEAARVQWKMHSGLPASDVAEARLDDAFPGLPIAPLPETLGSAISEAIENSSGVQAAAAEIATAQSVRDGVRAGYWPQVVAETRMLNGENYGGTPGGQRSYYAGVGLTWAIPLNPGIRYGDMAAAEGVESARNARDSQLLKIRADVETQWYELLAAQAMLRTSSLYASSAEQVVEAYRAQFKLGRRSLLDVLNSENELFTARSNAQSARFDVVISSWRLLMLRGLVQQELGL